MLSNEGLYVSKQRFNDLKTKNTAKTFAIKEVLPKNIPVAVQKHPRVLKLYRVINVETVQIARSLCYLLDNIDHEFIKCKKIQFI